jgi:hypothetical protein
MDASTGQTMTRDEWRRLFQLRRQLTDESFSDDTIDAWTDALPKLDYAAGAKAMTGAAKERDRVTLHRFTAELPHQGPTRTHTTSIGAPGCVECDGCGFSEHTDPHEPGVIRWAPCATCRPDDLAAMKARAARS